MNSLLASAVASFGTRCRGLTQPVLRAVRLLTPTYSNGTQRAVAEGYTRATGYQVVYTQQPQSRIAAEVLFQLATNVSLYDGWTLDVPTSEAILRARGVALLDELAADPAVEEQLADSDVHPFFQEYGALYDGKRTGVVISGQVPLLYWRRDVFARFNLSRAPASWDQMLAVARLLNGTDLDGDGTPDAALCWQTEGCIDSNVVIASVLASLTQYQGRSTGWLFNPHDMTPLAAGEPLRRALGLFRELTRYEQLGSSGCTYAATAFLTGNCAMTVKYGHQFKFAELGYQQLHGKVGVAPLPGSSVVWDREASAWLSCDAEPSPCTFATVVYDSLVMPAAAAGGGAARRRAAAAAAPTASTTAAPVVAVGRVNRAPFCGMTALLGSVDWRAPAGYQAAAFNFFAQATSPSASWGQLLDVRSAVGPFRRQHLDPANVDRWLQEGGYDRGDLLAFLDAWSDAVDHGNAALPLRLPGAASLTDALYWAAQQALGSRSLDDVMSELGAKLQAALQGTGVSAEEIQRTYWRNLNYRNPPEPPASKEEAEGLSYGARVAVAVAVTVTGLALVVLLSYMWYRRRRLLRRTLFGRALAPGASPATSLVVTDIVDSTRLWETVPPTAMARAVQLHHDTLRSLLELHNGYESATEGDSFILSFYTAADAVAFALRAQAALLYQPWPEELFTVELCRPQYAVCRVPGGLGERPRSGIPRASLLPSRITQTQTSLGSEAFGTQSQLHITGMSSPRITATAADGVKGPRLGVSRPLAAADDSLYGGSGGGGGSGPLLRLPGAAAQLATPKLLGASMSHYGGGGGGSVHSMPLQRRRRYALADGSCAGAASGKALSPVTPLASGSGPSLFHNPLRGKGFAARLYPSTPQLTLAPGGPGSPGGSQSQLSLRTSGLLPSRKHPPLQPPPTGREQHRLCKRPPGRGRPASSSTLPYIPRRGGSASVLSYTPATQGGGDLSGSASLHLPPAAAAGAAAGSAVEPAPSGLLQPAARLEDTGGSTPRIGGYSPPLTYSSDAEGSVRPQTAPVPELSGSCEGASPPSTAPVVVSGNCTADVSGALFATTGLFASSVSTAPRQLGAASGSYGISSTHDAALLATTEASGGPMAAVAVMMTADENAAQAPPVLLPDGGSGGGSGGGGAGRALDSERLSVATFTGIWAPVGSPNAAGGGGAAAADVKAERAEELLLEVSGRFHAGAILLEDDIEGMAEEQGHAGKGMSASGPAVAATAVLSGNGMRRHASGLSFRACRASQSVSGIDGAVAAAETRIASDGSGRIGSGGVGGGSTCSGSATAAAQSGALSSVSGAMTSASLGLMAYRRTSVPLIAALMASSGVPSGIDNLGISTSGAAGGGGAIRSLTLGAYYQQLFRVGPAMEAGAVRVAGGLQVRMGVHSGVASTQVSYNRVAGRTQYSGAALEAAKVVCDAAQGGMVLLSRSTFEQLTRPGGGGGVSGGREPPHVVLDMGTHVVKAGPDPVQLYMAQSRELLARLAVLGRIRSSEQLEPGVLEGPLGDVSMGSLTVVGLPTLLAWDKEVTEEALATFRRVVVSGAMRRLGGHLVEEGSGRVLAAFGHPYDAIRWAAACEALLKEADWSEALLSHELAEEVQGPVLLNSHMDAPVLMADGDLSRMLFRGLRVKGAVDCCGVRAELVAATGRLAYRGNLAANVQRIAAYVSTGQVVCSRRAWRGYEASLDLAAEVAGEADVVGACLGNHSIRGLGDKVELWSIRLSEGLYDHPYDEDFDASLGRVAAAAEGSDGTSLYITQQLPSDGPMDFPALDFPAPPPPPPQVEGASDWRQQHPQPPRAPHPHPHPAPALQQQQLLLQLNHLPPVIQSRRTHGSEASAAAGGAAAAGVAGGGDAGGGGGEGGMGFRLGASLAGALQVHSRAWDVTGEELRNMLTEQ